MNQYRFVPALKNMPNPLEPPVERLGIDSVEEPYSQGKYTVVPQIGNSYPPPTNQAVRGVLYMSF